MWAQFVRPLEFTPREMELLTDLSEGFTGSDIQEVCLRLQRRRTATKKSPSLKEALPIMQNIAMGEGEDRRFLARLRGKDEHAMAAWLRERNAKLYSHSALADLFGVSKATAHRWATGVKIDA
jgi:hypothetical protein